MGGQDVVENIFCEHIIIDLIPLGMICYDAVHKRLGKGINGSGTIKLCMVHLFICTHAETLIWNFNNLKLFGKHLHCIEFPHD